jgi:hypothetical protein
MVGNLQCCVELKSIEVLQFYAANNKTSRRGRPVDYFTPNAHRLVGHLSRMLFISCRGACHAPSP